MELFLIRAFQLILSLSILVLIHELGHFLFATAFQSSGWKSSICFSIRYFPSSAPKRLTANSNSPGSAKIRRLPSRMRPKRPNSGLGWVPLGGYCAISGMIDESMNKEAMAEPEKPWEFRSQKAGKRLAHHGGRRAVQFHFGA